MYEYKTIEKWVLGNDLPKYRSKQIYQAICRDLVDDWAAATNLPANLKILLSQELPISSLKVVNRLDSNKGDAIKIACKTEDDMTIESVLMRHEKNRNTVCVSTQVGCSMGCKFCATGAMGCKRNLSAEEIVDQVFEFARMIKPDRITNIVFMGMGEPFLNYDEVIRAVKLLHDQSGFNLGARHMTISTSGIIPGITKMAKEQMQLNLAISLHAATDALRNKLMPINIKYPLDKMLSAVADYMKRTNRKVFFEYILLDRINDNERDASLLVDLLSKKFSKFMSLVHINLIEYNPIEAPAELVQSKFRVPERSRVQRFHEILRESGISTTIRYKFGQAIKAGCGQLAGKK